MRLAAGAGVPAEILHSGRRADPACGRPQQMADIPLEVIDTFLAVQIGELSPDLLHDITPATLAYLEASVAIGSRNLCRCSPDAAIKDDRTVDLYQVADAKRARR